MSERDAQQACPMAAVMRNWLSATIEQEAIEAIQWQTTELHGPATHHESADFVGEDAPKIKLEISLAQRSGQSPQPKKFTNDGSNIRILCSGTRGKYVQLLDFLDFKPPYPAVLSDGTSRIKAKFSNTSYEQFHRRKKRNLSQETRGGVFLLFAYEIVVSCHTVNDQITLLIKEFEFKGAAGSPPYGKTVDIAANVTLAKIVDQLRSLDGGESTGPQSLEADSAHVDPSSPTAVDLITSNRQISQSASFQIQTQFASQSVPTNVRPTLPDLAVVGGTNLQSPRGPRKGETHSETDATATDMQSMLNLLRERNKASVNPGTVGKGVGNVSFTQPSDAPRFQPGFRGHTSPDIVDDIVPILSATRRNDLDKRDGLPVRIAKSRDLEGPNKSVPYQEEVLPKSLSSGPSHRSGSSDPSNRSRSAFDYDRFALTQGKIVTSNPNFGIQPPSLVADAAKSSKETIKEIESLAAPLAASEQRRGENLILRSLHDQNSHGFMPNSEQIDSPGRSAQERKEADIEKQDLPSPVVHEHKCDFDSMKSVHKVEAVPTRQMRLLKRPESWQYPKPGNRFPCPNVPVHMLESLNKQAENLLATVVNEHLQSRENRTDQARAVGRSNSDCSVSDDDSEVRSSPERSYPWEATPAQSQNVPDRRDLPPDSSADVSRSPQHGFIRQADGPADLEHNSAASTTGSPESHHSGYRIPRNANGERNAQKPTYNKLPDDSSDLEMEPPRALPVPTTQYRRGSPVYSAAPAKHLTTIPSSHPLQNSYEKRFTPYCSPLSRKQNPLGTPRTEAMTTLPPGRLSSFSSSASDALMMLTSKPEPEHKEQQTPDEVVTTSTSCEPYGNQAIGDLTQENYGNKSTTSGLKRRHNSMSTTDRSPLEVKRPFLGKTSLGMPKQIVSDKAAALHNPRQEQAIANLEDRHQEPKSTASGMKRKHNATSMADQSPQGVKNPFGHNLGLASASQVVSDPGEAARQARHAFMRENKLNPNHDMGGHRQSLDSPNLKGPLKRLNERSDLKASSPSSHKPRQSSGPLQSQVRRIDYAATRGKPPVTGDILNPQKPNNEMELPGVLQSQDRRTDYAATTGKLPNIRDISSPQDPNQKVGLPGGLQGQARRVDYAATRSKLPNSRDISSPQESSQKIANTVHGASVGKSSAPPFQNTSPHVRSGSAATSGTGIQGSPERNEDYRAQSEIYVLFTRTYPKYRGNLKHFLALCRKILANGTLHRSLWDDFIVRHRSDYIPYVSKCTEDGGEALPYEQFYNKFIETPFHVRRIMNPKSMEQAFPLEHEPSWRGSSHQEPETSRSSSVIPGTAVPSTFPSATYPSSSVYDSSSHPSSSLAAQPVQYGRDNRRSDSYRPSHPGPGPPGAFRYSSPPMNAPTGPSNLSAEKRNFSSFHGIPGGDTLGTSSLSTSSARPRQSLPWDTAPPSESKQRKSLVLLPNVAKAGKNTHLSKALQDMQTHTSTRIANGRAVVADRNTSPGTEVLDSIEVSWDPEDDSKGWQGADREIARKQVARSQDVAQEISTTRNAWWQENDTPFKEFTRNYASLKVHHRALGVPSADPVLRFKPGQWNVLDWEV